MTTRTIERCRAKCDQYWPLDEKTYCTVGNFCIINNSVERDKDWVISTLSLANTETNEKRTVVHMQFTSWPDFGESRRGFLGPVYLILCLFLS